jgi:valyl-tRNA synthetase
MAAPGTDIVLSEDRMQSGRAFANKIWNATRFVFFNLQKIESTGLTLEDLAAPDVRARAPYSLDGKAALEDAWIFSRLSAVSAETGGALESFRFHEAAQVMYHFFWGEICDWYIEWIKPRLTDADTRLAAVAWKNLFAVLEAALRLLSPFMPFLTEELWHKLPQQPGARSIALERYPEARADWTNLEAEARMAALQEIIAAARNVRGQLKVDAKQKLSAEFYSADEALRSLAAANLDAILRLATLSALEFTSLRPNPAGGAMHSTAQFDLRVARGAEEEANPEAERARLRKERDRLSKDLESKRARLADDTFRSRAPVEIVRNMESTLAERQLEFDKLAERLEQLGG